MGFRKREARLKREFLAYFVIILLTSESLLWSQADPSKAQSKSEARSNIADVQAKAEAGDAAAQFSLGRAYAKGDGVTQSDEAAFKWYSKAAERGNASAQNSLGVMYLRGSGVEESRADALRLFHEAARQKNGEAMFNLGASFYNGDRKGNGINDAQAYAWFKLAEENGSDYAKDAVRREEKELPMEIQNSGLLRIAEMYSKGDELPQDKEQAARWASLVAERGDVDGQVELAKLLLTAPAPDYAQAFHWSQAAAKSGNAVGQYYLAQLYQKGLGTAKDPKQALEWYERSGAGGVLKAKEAAGQMLATGEAGKKDLEQAFIYFIHAAIESQGDQTGLRAAARVRGEMTSKQWKKVRDKLRQEQLDPEKIEAALHNNN